MQNTQQGHQMDGFVRLLDGERAVVNSERQRAVAFQFAIEIGNSLAMNFVEAHVERGQPEVAFGALFRRDVGQSLIPVFFQKRGDRTIVLLSYGPEHLPGGFQQPFDARFRCLEAGNVL